MSKDKKTNNKPEIENIGWTESEWTNENPIILDAISQNPDDVIKMYEWKVVNSYSTLGVSENGELWNNRWECLYNWTHTSMYNNKKIINDLYTENILKDFANKKTPLRIADFWWWDWFVLNTIIEQLQSKWITAIGANIDQSLKVWWNEAVRSKYQKNKEELWNKKRQVIWIGADFLEERNEIHIKENSLDCIVMRYSLQYSGNEKRKKMLEEIIKYLKPGGKVYCLWPWATSDEQAIAINKPRWEFAKITEGIDSDLFLQGKRLPSLQQVEKDSLAAGFKIIQSWECENFISMYSIEWITNWSRFKKFKPEQKEKFENFMRQLHKEYPKHIENEKMYKNPNMFIILEK